MLTNIRIVLIHTSHPGNIGSVARAMKTMGVQQLYLVAPAQYPHPKALELASGASDILQTATVVEDLDSAIADCHLVVGTSARMRSVPWPLYTPKQMVEKIAAESADSQVAILFGREQSGLTNEELQRCHWHVQIPANPDYSSLNLAAAVQIITYELRMQGLETNLFANNWDYRLANADEMEKLFIHLETVLVQLDFLKLTAPRKLMMRLRRFLLRARPDVMEINILRGLLGAIEAQAQAQEVK
jgi:tRNA (cytidine32/uridine32-2'-O)-methyltransferase